MYRAATYILLLVFLFGFKLDAQDTNCFFRYNAPDSIVISGYENANQTIEVATANVEVDIFDTIAQVSDYLLGNSLAAWLGNVGASSVFTNQTKILNPSLIRYPGGSWSNNFFWDASNSGQIPGVPDSIIDGTNGEKRLFSPEYGGNVGNWRMTTDQYYSFREETGSQGLITVNYGYARYGRTADPVAQAAHLAAEWVRYDNGRTLFWEVGNENSGPWESGWQIDLNYNNDGQPEIVTGELYGQHFLVFADSMRKAAADVGAEIYIGAQLLHYDASSSWNIADREWNEGVLTGIGDAADFYVVHNYFGTSANLQALINAAYTEIGTMMDFILSDIEDKEATLRPVAITEWNINQAGGEFRSSSINGVQAVIAFNEMAKNNYGMSCRWLLANWNDDGIMYVGDLSPEPPEYSPRPAFFYIYYLDKFMGSNMISTSSDNTDILAYAYAMEEDKVTVIIVNKGGDEQVVRIVPRNYGISDRYFVYSLTGELMGSESTDFPQGVNVNSIGPDSDYWGPLADLETIDAYRYTLDDQLKIASPPYSVQFVLLESGEKHLTATNDLSVNKPVVYPNPFSENLNISYAGKINTIEIVNTQGVVYYSKKVSTQGQLTELKPELPGGLYVIRISTDDNNFIENLIKY